MANQSIQDIIAEVAREKGVPVTLALAIAQVESGLNPDAIGDGGHSVGLFQLNDRGEGAGMSVADREDPRRNAEIALTQVANVLKSNPNMSWGDIAAAAQRPKDRAGYAAKINQIVNNGVDVSQNTTSDGGPVLDENSLAASYGFAAAFFNSDPELSKLIQQATAQQWTKDKFTAEFQATKWYQAHAQSVRDFIALQTSDPATFNAKLSQAEADVKNAAAQVGAQLDDNMVKQIATNYLQFGWDSNQLQQAIGAHVSLGNAGGTAQDTLTQMHQYVSQMGVNLSDSSLDGYLRGIQSGTSSMGDFEGYIRRLAAGAFPAYADQIEGGQTVQQIADPYVQDMANILEINPANITLQDPTIRSMLSGKDANGQPAQTGLWDFEQKLRQDPRWQYTKNANDAGYSMIHQIGQDFGFLS